jgi:adenine-specific DNA glycosylase
VRHVFTHFELIVAAFSADVPDDTPAPGDARWIAERDVPAAGFPTLMRKILAAAE